LHWMAMCPQYLVKGSLSSRSWPSRSVDGNVWTSDWG
jgi:hypothetical protein